jgi:ferric-dicitrate binding protein FerR (iron transport regulator)
VTAARAKSRHLWGSDKGGKFRTRGRNSAATVRGTTWYTKDTCTTTTTVVREGSVIVTDFAKHKHVKVKAGKRYVARAAKTK